MKNNIKIAIKGILIISVIICLSAKSDGVTIAVKDALDTCFYILLPSLFPFFVLSGMFVRSGCSAKLGKVMGFIMRPLFKISGNGAAAFVLGIISGYPVGAKTASDLYEQKLICKNEAESLTCFCNNSGPLFIIGAVGAGMLSSAKAGVYLYVIHILASVTVGILMRFTVDERVSPTAHNCPIQTNGAFSESVENAVKTILNVFGYVIFFAVIMQLLKEYHITETIASALSFVNLPKNVLEAIICSALEITTGIRKLSVALIPLEFKVVLISFILGWAGFSVHFQTKSIVKGLSFAKYLTGKVLHGAISLLYSGLFVRFSDISSEVFYQGDSFSYIPMNGFTIISCIILIIYFICLRDKKRNLMQTHR